MEPEKNLSEKESLQLITQMIHTAKDSYNDTGISAMMWGIVITICALVRLSEIQFGFHLPIDIYWLTVVAVIPQVLISIRENRQKKVRTYEDAFIDYIWIGFGISIFLMILITNSMGAAWSSAYKPAAGEKNIFSFYEYIAPFFLLLYGIPTFITGAACKFKPMLWGGILCWICCVVTIYTNLKVDLLLTALSATVAWFIPGIIMQRDYRKAKKELAKKDV
jgi:hypothetical protein